MLLFNKGNLTERAKVLQNESSNKCALVGNIRIWFDKLLDFW